MRKPPCYGCMKRCMLCHAHCDEYADWVVERKNGDSVRRAEVEAKAMAVERSLRIQKYYREKSK